MKPELKVAWKEVLFWARRLSYASVDSHPEWRVRYLEAKKKLALVKGGISNE